MEFIAECQVATGFIEGIVFISIKDVSSEKEAREVLIEETKDFPFELEIREIYPEA